MSLRNSKKLFCLFSLIIYLFFSFESVYAQSVGADALVLCRSAKAVRTLRVEKTKSNRCQAFYTKSGVDQNIGNSASFEACLEYIKKVRLTLEKANWVCKDVKDSTVSSFVDKNN